MKKSKHYRWFVLGIGVIAQATFSFGFIGIPVTGIIMRDVYQFSLQELGWVLGAMGLGVALSEITWGILTDKLGDKLVLTFGLFSMAFVYFGIGLYITPSADYQPDYLLFAGALMLAGVFGGSINSASGRTVMSWFMDGERSFAMSIRQTAIPVGGAMGTAILPWLALSFGFAVVFIVLTVLCISAAVVVSLCVGKNNDFEHTSSDVGEVQAPPLRNPAIWKVVASAGLLTVPQMAVVALGGLFMADYLNLGLTLISAILIFILIGGGVLRIALGKYTDINQNRNATLFKIALFCGLCGLFLAVFADLQLPALVLFVLVGLSSQAWHGVGYTEVAVLAGVNQSGTAIGMIGASIFFAAFVTPIMLSNILTFYQWPMAWAIVAALTLLPLVIMIRAVEQEKKQIMV